MHRIHITLIALLVGAAVVLGGLTLTRSRGAATPAAPIAPTMSLDDLAQQTARLDALEADLERRLAAAPKARAAGPSVRYVRSAPAASTPRHDDDEGDDEHEGGDDE